MSKKNKKKIEQKPVSKKEEVIKEEAVSNKEDEQNKKTKKYDSFQLGVIIVLTVLMLALCTVTIVIKVSDYLDQKKVMEQFDEYFESKDLEIIYFNATGCVYCELERPILDQIVKDYDLEYLDIDHTKLTKSQKDEIIEKLNIEGSTPTTVIVQNGEVVATHVGYAQGNIYVEFFVEAGVLEEGSTYIPEKNLTFIDYAEFAELTKSEEPVVVAIGGATCEFCTTAKPILSNLANAYSIPIYYLTLDYITAEERLMIVDDLKRMNFDDADFKELGSIGTPTVLVIQNDKVLAHQVGLGNVTSYTKLFKDNGVVKE